jgi:glutamine synthetase
VAELRAGGTDDLISESEALVAKLYDAIVALEKANADHPVEEGLQHALYMRDTVIPAMESVREVADRLERIVADDLWPLPKYSEMLFIK